MKIVDQIKFMYHFTKADKALKKRDKHNYNKHTRIVKELLWNNYKESK